MIVVLDLGTLGHIIAELAENVHNLLPYNAYRMTGAEFVAVSRHSQVLCGSTSSTVIDGTRLQFFDAGDSSLLEFVERPAQFFLLVLVNISEFVK